MDGISNILDKLSLDDVQKLKMLFSISQDSPGKPLVTLRVFRDEYEVMIENNRSANYCKSVRIAMKHLCDFFGLQKPIGSISLKDMEDFMMHLQRHVKKGYRVYYRTLKAAFTKAVEWGYIEKNHFTKIKLPKKNKLHPTFITEKQLKIILEKIPNEVVSDFVLFAYYTGMRLDEIINLKWRNLDLENMIIIVGDDEFVTKGKNQRYVPIGDEVARVLKNTRNSYPPHNPLPGRDKFSNGYVFCKGDGRKYTGDYFSRRFKRACRAAGMDESIHFHSLRHSFASNLVQRGVSLYVVKELLGHASISTTEIYSHLNVDSLRDAVSRLNARGEDGKHENTEPPLNLPLNKGETFKRGLRLVSGENLL
ncbi:MAG: tyrosine-type recombinase/integrase [Melioribacteraceae bacterium]|nr:tyrosine-type recombinase/integrase [Melioribacteraceae bacterium]MCF8353914.1 tyrosine-type recombinase/integrase [Melioribacteraceae bacterium]MCF8392671.1 tyrosine-type recombinase/integrase [Melioribacteraceae bacterium]MCF8417692.1 tyrosine-type recombinase/integrase [Melioribacteraceae bacterium]